MAPLFPPDERLVTTWRWLNWSKASRLMQRIALLACGPITHDTFSFADVERLQTV